MQTPGSAEQAREAFLTKLATKMPTMKVLDRSALAFDAGPKGAPTTVLFEPMPGFATIQIHSFRVDGGALGHLVGTLPERERLRGEAQVVKVLKSFRPLQSADRAT